MKPRACACSLRLVPDARQRAGRSEGCKVAEFSLYRGAYPRAVFDSADVRDVAFSVIPKADLARVEHALFILLDARRYIRAIATGTVDEHSRCGIRFADVMRLFDPVIDHIVNPPSRAPASNIGGILMVHNHPSGNALFSVEDVRAAYGIAQAFREAPFGLIDSLVVTPGGGYSSMREFAEYVGGLSVAKTVAFRSLK